MQLDASQDSIGRVVARDETNQTESLRDPDELLLVMDTSAFQVSLDAMRRDSSDSLVLGGILCGEALLFSTPGHLDRQEDRSRDEWVEKDDKERQPLPKDGEEDGKDGHLFDVPCMSTQKLIFGSR